MFRNRSLALLARKKRLKQRVFLKHLTSSIKETKMEYQVLNSITLDAPTAYHRPRDRKVNVTAKDSALEVMTDFKQVGAVTISPRENIDTANQIMKNRGIRLLPVVDADDHIVGIITAQDILSEKPMQFLSKNGGKRSDILVSDIMTPYREVDVLKISDVSRATVGDIVETLKHHHRQHALVVDNQGPDNKQTIRGIISLTQVARQLGISIKSFEVAENLAQISKVLKA